jgi:hypothetical protein
MECTYVKSKYRAVVRVGDVSKEIVHYILIGYNARPRMFLEVEEEESDEEEEESEKQERGEESTYV